MTPEAAFFMLWLFSGPTLGDTITVRVETPSMETCERARKIARSEITGLTARARLGECRPVAPLPPLRAPDPGEP